MPRVQVQDLPEPERFRPVQPTGDTFGGAPKPVQDNNLERLSSALASFGTSVARLAPQQPQGDHREAVARGIIASYNDPNFEEGYRSGRLPFQDVPHVNAIYSNRAGTSAARAVMDPLRTGIADGSVGLADDTGRSIDASTIIRQRAASAIAQMPPHQRGNVPFMRAFEGHITSASREVEDAARARQAAISLEVSRGVGDGALDDFLSRRVVGKSDDEVRAAWNETYANIRRGVALQPMEIDARMIGRLTDAASRNPEAVLRIVGEREGEGLSRGRTADGQQLGPIDSNPRLRVDVERIRRTALGAMATREDQRIEEQSVAEATRLLHSEDARGVAQLQNFQYPNRYRALLGEPELRTLDAERVRSAAYARWNTETIQQIQSQGASPENTAEAIYQRQRRAFINADRPNPTWQEEFQHTARIQANPVEASLDANVRRIGQSIRLYERISRENPGYLRTLGLSDDTQLFYQRVQIFRDQMGQPEAEAIRNAATSLQQRNEQLDTTARQQIDQAARSIGSSWLPSWLGGTSAGVNEMEARHAIRITAERLMTQGIKPEDAVKKAGEILSERVVVLNGRAFFGDRWVTRENLPFWQSAITKSLADAGGVVYGGSGAIRDASQLSVRPENNGAAFRITTRDGAPLLAQVPDPDNPGKFLERPLIIRPQDIQRAREEDAAARKATQQANIAHQQEIDSIRSQLGHSSLNRLLTGPPDGTREIDQETRDRLERRLEELEGPREGPAAGTENDRALRERTSRRSPFGSTAVNPRDARTDDGPDASRPPGPAQRLSDWLGTLPSLGPNNARSAEDPQAVREIQERNARRNRRRQQ